MTWPRPTSVPTGILVHPAIWPQKTWAENWGLCLFGGRCAGSPSNTMWPRPRHTSVPSGILILPGLTTTDMGQNRGLCPFWGRGAGSPSNTMWLGSRPTSKPSFILIHPTVWPQCTNVTDRTVQTGRQRSDSTGRTVLETVTQKSLFHHSW